MTSTRQERRWKRWSVSATWHGFNRSGGLMLGVQFAYPWNHVWLAKLSLVVVTFAITYRHEHRTKTLHKDNPR